MSKIEFSKQDLLNLWQIKRSRFERLLAMGIIPQPIKVAGHFPKWTPRQVREAERRQDERENPKPVFDNSTQIRPFRKNIKMKEPRASFFRQKLTDSDNK